jgi:flagellar biosynthesis chaperone FliJ
MLLFETDETLALLLLEIGTLQKELKQVNETLAEIKAQKKSIESKIVKKLAICVEINKKNEQKNVST